MKPRKRDARAVAAARALRDELGIREPRDLDLDAVAAARGFFVLDAPAEEEEGRSLRAGDVTLIRVRGESKDAARGDFTRAHEIGHGQLHPEVSQLSRCTRGDAVDRDEAWRREREADDFATELTLPEEQVRAAIARAMDEQGLTFEALGGTAVHFGMSLSATGIRIAELAGGEVALVHATAGTIDWAAESRGYQGKIVKRHALRRGTLAERLAHEESVPAGVALAVEVDGRLWGTEGTVVEEAIRTDYGAVLSWVRKGRG